MKKKRLDVNDVLSVFSSWKDAKPYARNGVEMTDESMMHFALCLSVVRGPFKRFCAASGKTVEETKEFNLGRFYSLSLERERKERIRQDNENLVAARLEAYRQQADKLTVKKKLSGPLTEDDSVENEQVIETSKVVEFARLIGIFAG